MTERIKLTVLFALSAFVCFLFSAVTIGVSAENGKNFIIHGTSYSATGTYDGNEYLLVGTQGRGRVGMIVNQPLNVYKTVSFDMELDLCYKYTEDEVNLNNRTYILTFNQYAKDETGLPKTSGNVFSDANGPDGVQVHFIPSLWGYDGPVARISAHGKSKTVDLSDIDGFSVLKNYDTDNMISRAKMQVNAYLSDGNGNAAEGYAEYFTVSLRCYNEETGELTGNVAILTVSLSDVSETGGFTSEPYLGFYLVNEAGSSLGKSTAVPVNLKISGLKNGRVKRFTFEETEIKSLKPDQPVTLNPVIFPWEDGDDLEDITFTYSSDNSAVTVSEQGVLTTSANGGYAVITAKTSEGNTFRIPVLVYDEQLPVLEVMGDVPENGTQYCKTVLPGFVASDNSGTCVTSLKVSSPETVIIDVTAEEYSFIPSTYGTYTVVYSAKDAYGNVTEKRFNIEVAEADNSGKWTAYRENYAYVILDESEEGDALDATLTVGSMEEGESLALVYSNKPITFTKKADGTWTSFSFKLAVSVEDVSWRAGSELDLSRLFTLYLMESYEDGTITAEQFGRDKKGMETAFGIAPYWADKTAMRYRLRSYKSASMSEQNISSIDTYSEDGESRALADVNRNNQYGHGSTYLPWFEYGQALNFANKYLSGETVNVTVEYAEDSWVNDKGKIKYDRYYKWSFDDFTFKIPADYVNGNETGYERQAFFGFKLWSRNGVVKYNVRISDVMNGSVKDVSFYEGKESVRRFGEEFTLNPFVTDNYGETTPSAFTYKSGDTSVATIDDNGKVTIVGYGTVSVFATSSIENKSATHTISVDVPMFELLQEVYTIPLGKDGVLPIITGAKAPVPIKITSSDPFGLVALDGGTVQGIAVGEYTVTATYLGYSAQCVVKVVAPTEEQEVNPPVNGNGCSGNAGNGSSVQLGLMGLLSGAIYVLLRRRKSGR